VYAYRSEATPESGGAETSNARPAGPILKGLARNPQLRPAQLPIALAGAGLPQLPGLMVDAKSYAERLFSYPEIGPLSPDAARQALFEPAQAEGVGFQDDALARIVELSGCYVAFVQAYGKETWQRSTS
jgi:hypothetical protein